MKNIMKSHHRKTKLLFSAGGTGGHIFPALAVAKYIKNHFPETEILFVGSKERKEMEIVPHHGFPIVGLSLRSGLKRNLSLHNFKVLRQTFQSLREMKKILKEYKPDIVVGFGGYITGPVLKKAICFNIPVVIQEQNAIPGLTNRLLAHKANFIFTGFDGMDKYFDASKIIHTGNPVREDIINNVYSREEAIRQLGLNHELPVLLVLGGTLGSRSINHAMLQILCELNRKNIQVIWQTGKHYYVSARNFVISRELKGCIVEEFIEDMPRAYAAADIIIARAGALTLAELQVVGKPSIVIPSPHVTNDHQTKNARKLYQRNAIILLHDSEINNKLLPTIEELLNNAELRQRLASELKKMANPDATNKIAHLIMEIAELKKISKHE
ncbi:MAG: undecaprenyldiphospho-muramoylpentapeptide beta-N-acetylglucosaminyltransferase [Bacteroidales bacterium]|nr:undecaprenyldiphospho-muramoylpentapeptide beta-N-acetylglucosaminyltransferase [Bacteroidales bacterium]